MHSSPVVCGGVCLRVVYLSMRTVVPLMKRASILGIVLGLSEEQMVWFLIMITCCLSSLVGQMYNCSGSLVKNCVGVPKKQCSVAALS